jgi:hypothetical protein
MRPSKYLMILIIAISACASPTPGKAQPPPGFPDLSKFTAVDPSHFNLGGTAFVTPEQVSCVLDYGPQKSIVCSGDIQGIPASASGTGCPVVRKVDE